MKDYNQSTEFTFYHRTPIQIRFNDIDPVGHVNNAVYQEYFDFGRVSYFDEVLNFRDTKRDTWLVIANVNTEYINQIYLRDKIWLETKIPRIGNKSLEMHQRIILEKYDKQWIAAYNKTIMVGINLELNQTIPILDSWKKSIALFEKDITF
ncbi:MAG: acyl-CoA thioesterase [Bacteroidales bacterium]|nr:acyl-CoA thioesterase [Bacteroidales bacterium]